MGTASDWQQGRENHAVSAGGLEYVQRLRSPSGSPWAPFSFADPVIIAVLLAVRHTTTLRALTFWMPLPFVLGDHPPFCVLNIDLFMTLLCLLTVTEAGPGLRVRQAASETASMARVALVAVFLLLEVHVAAQLQPSAPEWLVEEVHEIRSRLNARVRLYMPQ